MPPVLRASTSTASNLYGKRFATRTFRRSLVFGRRVGSQWTKDDDKKHMRMQGGLLFLALLCAQQWDAKRGLQQKTQEQQELKHLREVKTSLETQLAAIKSWKASVEDAVRTMPGSQPAGSNHALVRQPLQLFSSPADRKEQFGAKDGRAVGKSESSLPTTMDGHGGPAKTIDPTRK